MKRQTAIKTLRKQYQDRFVDRQDVIGLYVFFVKATVEALKEYRVVNAKSTVTILKYKNYYNIGVAELLVAWAMVPVVRNVDQLSFAEVEGDTKIGFVMRWKASQMISKVEHLPFQMVGYLVR